MKRLFCAAVMFAALLSSCKKEEQNVSLPDYHPTGVIPDKPEVIARTKVYDGSDINARIEALPGAIDLSAHFPAVGNQGSQGSCVGWAVGYYLKSFQEKVQLGWDPNRNAYSPSWIYNQINGGSDNGSSISDAMNLLTVGGCDLLRYFPYNQNDYTARPDGGSRTRAARYPAAHWGYVKRTLEAHKQFLAMGHPIVISIDVRPDFDNLNSSNPVYDNLAGNIRGRHALCLVGYDDNMRAFKFVNSWGKSWGINGYGWISYDLIANDNYDYYAYLLLDAADEPTYYKNMIAIKKSNTSNGRTELHSINGNWEFQTFTKQVSTILHSTGNNFEFTLNDYNRDGVNDLIAVAKYNTGSGKTEVHVMDGNNNYQSWLLQVPTCLHQTDGNFKFLSGDYNRDGIVDIYAIKKNGGSGKTEVHVLNGATRYSTFLLNVATPLGVTNDRYDFSLFDYNRDGTQDLVVIAKNQTGTNSTEIHVLNGANLYQNWLLHTGTCMHVTDSNYEFAASDLDMNGSMDLVIFKKKFTGTQTTEVHAINGSTHFQSFLHQSSSVLHETDNTFQILMR